MREENFRKRMMLLDLSELQKKTDTAFQLRRRLEEADDNGIVRCISCGAYHHYKMCDGGHFIQRQHKGVRYAPLNVWPQCKQCNYHLSGNHAKYRENLLKKIGQDGIDDIESNKDKMPFVSSVSWREWCIEVLIESKRINAKLKRSIAE